MSAERFKQICLYVLCTLAALASWSFLSTRQGEAVSPRSTPTFNRDVAPIFYKNCARCHGPGELASSIPLTSYETAHARAASIRKWVASRAMPPWPVDPARSLKFSNDARLSQKDIDTIVAWADAGAPRGDGVPPKSRLKDIWASFQGPSRPDMLSIYTPGSGLETYADGSGKLLKGGANNYVIFNIHYQTTCKPEIDRSKIALWFASRLPSTSSTA